MDNPATATQRPTARARFARYLWRAHAALLLLVGGYIAWAALASTPDANIGLGLGLLALGALGAPWSLAVLLDGRVNLDSWLFVGAATGTAILNLVLTGLMARWWIARTASRSRRMGR